MKTLFRTMMALGILLSMVGCKAFRTLNSEANTSQGRPYELILVCAQDDWMSEVGDTLRSVLTAPVPYLNQTEPLFDVQRVLPAGFKQMIVKHRNILKVLIDPAIKETSVAVQYDLTAKPQIVLTLQGPDRAAVTAYVDAHRSELVHVLEKAERDRSVANNIRYNNPGVEAAIKRTFGVKMAVPKGYVLAVEQEDFLWARYEYPAASQGFFVYSYPYEGTKSLTAEALIAARNRFAARIPGPADGSYMTTSEVFAPELRMFRMEGRLWCELRGFWDVKGDFMGGPFVSYTTVDTERNRVFTVDGYVYSPKLHKRNFVRGIEHLLYGISFEE